MKNVQKIPACLVHIFTGSGIIFSFMALVSVIEGYKLQAFMFLGIALLVDIFDGTLARKYKTETIFPNIDGKTLDTIIDYINYIFIPCIMIYKFGYLPTDFKIIIPIFIICVSIYSYVNTKLIDTSFSYLGFPSIWNVILLYLEILSLNQWINLFIILLFISLKFVPFRVIHPMRNVAFKKTNITFLFGTLLTSSILLMSKLEVKFINDFYFYFLILWLIFNSYFILLVFFSNLLSSKLYKKLRKT
jgi:phosphatidylcholine synthase